MNKFYLVVLTLSAVACGTYGNYWMKLWTEGKGVKAFALGQFIFALGSILFSLTLKFDQLITVVCFALACQLTMNYALGTIVFKEEFTRIQSIGAVAIIAGAAMLISGGE